VEEALSRCSHASHERDFLMGQKPDLDSGGSSNYLACNKA